MKKIPKIFYDLIILGCLFAVNPIITHFNQSIRETTQDILLYLAMAEQAIPKALMFLPGWEHVDKGIILPPAFPFMIAFGQMFSSNSLAIAEIISHLSMLIATACVYFCVKLLANRIVAVLAAFIIQVNYYYMLLGFWPLPGALFLCFLCISVLLVFYLMQTQTEQLLASLGLGLITAILFLTAQPGLVIFIFLIVWFTIHAFSQDNNFRKTGIKRTLLIALGFVLISGPYLFVLSSQTGHSPFTKHFRFNEYAIHIDDASIIESIKKSSEDTSTISQNVSLSKKSMLTLLDDNSEILKDVLLPVNLKQDTETEAATSFSQNLKNNFKLLFVPLNGFLAWILLASLITPFFNTTATQTRSVRLFLPLLIIGYITGVSFGRSVPDIQIFLVYPFAVIHIAIEIYHSASKVRKLIPSTQKYIGCCLAASLGFLVLVYLFPTKLYKEFTFPTQKYSSSIEKISIPDISIGEPAFSVNPIDAYRTGFSFRTLPNANLEKIFKYGKATGVRFLLYDWKNPNNLLYRQANWMGRPGFVRSDYVKSSFRKNSLSLYELQDPDKK